MLIDWFTVGAQVLNFLILVWMMKRFLYKPILKAIDERENRIAAELADADARKAEAQLERDEFKRKNNELEQARAAMLCNAATEADAERQRLFNEARKAADDLIASRQETLRAEARNLNQAITRRTQDEVFAIARRALSDLSGTDLEAQCCDVFTRLLRAMDGDMKSSFGDALKASTEPALVRSAFELPTAQRSKLQQAINETFSADIPLRFETAPDLISGIELTTSGQKLAWSIAEYLTSLEKGVAELLKEKGKPQPKPEEPTLSRTSS